MAASRGERLLADVAEAPPPPAVEIDKKAHETPLAAAIGIVRIGWPMAISNLVMWAQSFFTIWLLGGNGKKLSMAAFGLANVVCNVTGHSFLWGIGAGLDTLASQAWGAREHKAIGLYNQRVLLILTLLVNVPVVALWVNASPILIALRQDPEVASQVSAYARIRVPGLFAQSITCCLSKTLTAMGKTTWLLGLNFFGIVVSALLAWLLIADSSPLSGQWVTPIVGSAVMSSAVDGLAAVALLLVALCDAEVRRCWPGWTRQCWYGWGSYLRLAVPAMLMGIFEWWSWDAVNFLAGLCPEPQTALATNALLGNIISLAYCLPVGLQAGVQTLVGNALGANSPRGGLVCARIGGALALVSMCVQCVLLYTFRSVWAHLFDAEPAVGAQVTSLLQWVVFFCGGDIIQLVLSGVITGAGKQAVTTPILGVSYWVLGLPLGAFAAFRSPRNGLLGLWWGMTGAVWLHVLAYVAICFAHPWLPFGIDWPLAARHAAERLNAGVADAAGVDAADGDDAPPPSAPSTVAVEPLFVGSIQGGVPPASHSSTTFREDEFGEVD